MLALPLSTWSSNFPCQCKHVFFLHFAFCPYSDELSETHTTPRSPHSEDGATSEQINVP